MTTTSGIIERYAAQIGTPGARMLHSSRGNVFVGHHYARDGAHDDSDDPTLYSYGHHFPIATLRPDADGSPRGWWLVNGDRYSASTSRHQSEAQNALKRTGLPMMTVPFSAIREARIERNSITPVEILPDRYTSEPRRWKSEDRAEPQPWQHDYYDNLRKVDGEWWYDMSVHHLGVSLFTATYTVYNPETNGYDNPRRYYLSAFDENEPGFGLYFLAELPGNAHPETVAEAFELLKPPEVVSAEKIGATVLRQGDVFAIERLDIETRKLPGPSLRSAYVLGVNHQATEVRDEYGTTFARGFLRHRPRESWRRPEHRTLKLGDGKAWYQLVRNTVPNGRSWSISGNVD